ncbi:leukocyte surface antigen CD53-like isoform X2 [Narcine bancroftii]
MGLGIYMMGMKTYGALLPSLPSLSITNILIIVGTITMVVAFLGCTGAIKENKCLLFSFFILLFLILLTEILAAIILFFYEKQIDNYIKKDMKRGLEDLQVNNGSDVREVWDKIQQQLHCCGVLNYTDWRNEVPQSCCPGSRNCDPKDYWAKGCYTQIQDWFESNFLTIGIVIISTSVIQIIGMSFAITLFCHISNNSKLYGE